MDTKNISFNIFFLFMSLFTLFVTSSHFVDKEVLPKWYTFYIIILFDVLFFLFITKSINLKIDSIAFTLCVLIGYLLLGCSFSSTFAMSTMFQCVGFLLLFLFFKLAMNQNGRIIAVIITGTCTLQAIYGILQLMSVVNNNSTFAVVGSFDNPAGFAASLTAGFAFSFSLFGQKRYLNSIVCVAMLIIGISIFISHSRAGIIAVFVISAIFLYHKFKYKISEKNKRWIFTSLLLVSILLLSTLFLFKKDSATGRLLIWETTVNMIAEKPILGWGSHSFRSHYMIHQADYFEKHPNSLFEPLADNVPHPFNQYLLLTAEQGIIGLILLFILIFTVYKEWDKEDIIFKLSILSILIFACFSYPLRYPFVWLILAYSLAKLSNSSVKIYYYHERKFSPVFRFAIIVILFSCFYYLVKDIQFEYKWNKIACLSLMGKTKSVMSQYEELNTHRNGNPLFLYNYGAELNYIKQYDKSALILLECEKYYNDYDVQMLLGNNYFNLKEWNKAEAHYTNASLMCPNRFLPLGELMNIYDSIGRNDAVIKIASEICSKPVKIKSRTIYKIKFKAKQRLNNLEFDK